MACRRSRPTTTSSFGYDDEGAVDSDDIAASFQTDLSQDRNTEFSLLKTILSDLSFLVGREVESSGLQLALRKQQERIKRLLAEKRKQVTYQPQKIHGRIRRVVTGDENKRVRDLLAETRRKPNVVRSLDKVTFTGGVLNLITTEYILLLFPDYFWIYFCILMPTLIALRYVYYIKKKMTWFMLDFCYFTQLSMVLFFVFVPYSCTWWKVNFLYSLGPLSWAIPVWRNSLVFHDLEKVTSVYLHTFPALACACMRFVAPNPAVDLAACGNIGFGDAAFAITGYIVWQALYYLETEVWDRDILDADPDQLTSLRWLVEAKKSLLYKATLFVLRKLYIMGRNEEFDNNSTKTKFIFMIGQFAFTLITGLPVPLLYISSHACAIFMVFILGQAIWNGSNFYIEVFSRRYWDNVFKLSKTSEVVESIVQLQQEVISPLDSADEPHGDGSFSNGAASPNCQTGIEDFSQLCIKED